MQAGSCNGCRGVAWQEKTGTWASHPEHKSRCQEAGNTHRGPLPDPQQTPKALGISKALRAPTASLVPTFRLCSQL